MEDFTGMNDVWKHYVDETFNNAEGKLSQSTDDSLSISQNDTHFVNSSNVTENLSHHKEHTLT